MKAQTSPDLHLAAGVSQKLQLRQFIIHLDKTTTNVVQRLHTANYI